MKAVIIDASLQACNELSALLRNFCPHVQVVGSADNADSACELLLGQLPDIVFLDPDVPGDSSFNLLERLGKAELPLVLTSACTCFEERAFQYHALDYLHKPLEPQRLVQAVHKAEEYALMRYESQQYHVLQQYFQQKEQTSSLWHRISFSTQTEIVFSYLRDLIHIRADANCCRVSLADQARPLFIVRNIGEFERQLAPFPFMLRVHRSHLVNLYHVKKLLREENLLLLSNNETVPVVSAKREPTLQFLGCM